MAESKSINIFLIDGESTGRIKCTLQNWTGVAYKIPRLRLKDCGNENTLIGKLLKQTGVYFLFGVDQNDKQIVYIGQAGVRKNKEGLLNRLLEHNRNEKEPYYNDWNEVICFTTQNDILGPTEISYLENKFTIIANKTGRYFVKNGNEPNQGNITEEKKSEMDEFIKYAKIITSVLGHKVFEQIIESEKESTDTIQLEDSPIFYFKRNLEATGMLTNEGFVVLKGSELSSTFTNSCPERALKDREKYKGLINQYNKLDDNILFTSPSAAACFVAGSCLSGNALWKTKDNKSPKDF